MSRATRAARVVFWTLVAIGAGVLIAGAGWLGQHNRCAWLADHQPNSRTYHNYCE